MPTSASDSNSHGPALHLYLTEPSRSFVDFGQLATARSVLRTAPRGDEHPVVVLPGLLASDVSTATLRWYLARLGYRAHGWDLGRNIGPTPTVLDGMRARVRDLAERHGETVSLIGWSLGGIYARELAREMPHLVRYVITLGSPFRHDLPPDNRARRVFQLLSPLHVPESVPPPEHTRPPLAMPATSVYSVRDGIVPWRTCIDTPGPRRENIAVNASHLGYGHNPAVLWLTADRLSQAPGTWEPFVPPPALARHFPADVSASVRRPTPPQRAS
ncbi:esterase/lipase family protein [Kribbella sindirgiensis]|uniref:Alpha/beta hydrolase n=1 Tax=Kribbella sindirgiensis TaxID=1124744 RepID=A0A4R0IG15_9ACTN|nr:alpha/beta hydrolase [Kribbella sindirgiensis]TCC32241.1 alpha/beta hydrolase [Kribbella sindirgiensis]